MKGSITEKGTGKWLIRAYAGRVNGKTTHVNRTVYGSKRDAQRALAKLVTDVSGGKVSAGQSMTLAQLIERWLHHISPQRTPRTIHEYRRVARQRHTAGARDETHRQADRPRHRQLLPLPARARSIAGVGAAQSRLTARFAWAGGQVGLDR